MRKSLASLYRIEQIQQQDVFRLASEKAEEIEKKRKKDEAKDESDPFVFEEDFFDAVNGSEEMVRLQWFARIMNICGEENYQQFIKIWENSNIVELYEYYAVKMAMFVMKT